MPSEPATLPNHLYTRGLLGGRHSDIDIKVFGKTYPLHRIVLDRAPFFASALSEPWAEATAKEVTLHPEEIDCNITQAAFELALRRLYGCPNVQEEEVEAIGLFATGCWLEMQDVINASVDVLLRITSYRTVSTIVQLLTSNYYGRAGARVLSAAKTMLNREGAEMPLKYWDGIPSAVIQELVSGDGFFIQGEWERWILARRLFDRNLLLVATELGMVSEDTKRLIQSDKLTASRPRCAVRYMEDKLDAGNNWQSLYSHPAIVPLCTLLDEGIHYIFLEFEELQNIRAANDCLGVPLLADHVIKGALWSSMELRQHVLNAHENDMELALSKTFTAAEVPGQQSYDDASVDEESGSSQEPSVRRFCIPNGDCNIVFGNGDTPLITACNSNSRHSNRIVSGTSDMPAFFGDLTADLTITNPREASRVTKYSEFPPFRFAAEFSNPHLLKEKKRVYSRTVFYAGSLWNLYIQKVRPAGNKNSQLGVYLHRVKSYETEEVSSNVPGGLRASVDERIGALEREMILRGDHRNLFNLRDSMQDDLSAAANGMDLSRGDGTQATGPARLDLHRSQPGNRDGPSHHPRATASNNTTITNNAYTDPADHSMPHPRPHHPTHHHAIPPPYVDGRPTIKTYFKIYCPSRGGRVTNVYESAPDNFNFSQSWGWKSNTLLADEDFDVDSDGGGGEAGFGGFDGVEGERGRGRTLRFVVVIGVV